MSSKLDDLVGENLSSEETQPDPTTFDEDDDIEAREKANVNNILRAKITNYTNGLQVESVYNSLVSGYYLIPKFQRRFVWSKGQATNLILSLIKKVPIPPLYNYTNENGKEVILDGQQRVTTIFLYLSDLWYVGTNVTYKRFDFRRIDELNRAAKKVEEEIAERKKEKGTKKIVSELVAKRNALYSELKQEHGVVRSKFFIEDGTDKKDISYCSFSEDEKNQISHRRLDITIVQCDSKNARKVYADIFKLLNSGGKLLSSQEIRNGIFWESKLYDSLFKVNSHPTWRKIYGKESMFSKDVEILLKILALDHYTEISSNDDKEEVKIIFDGTFNWSNIMDNYSDESMSWNDSILFDEVDKLKQYLDSISNITEERCNRAVFEATFIAKCKLKYEGDIDYSWLCKMGDEVEFARGNVFSNKANVEGRLSKALTLLRGVKNA